MKFLSMYGDRISQFEDELFDLNEKIEEIDKEISVLISNLEKIDPSNGFALKKRRFLYFILIDHYLNFRFVYIIKAYKTHGIV